MEHMMDLKVQAVNKHLYAFKLRVVERPAHISGISSFRTELDRLWADLDVILAPPTDVPESKLTAFADDTVLDALFSEDIAQPKPTRAREKRPRSSHKSDITEDTRAKKWER
ncbi:hypothetical protein R3W88_016323 [Solanum pinnatisectum]|uniref:Integrase core domain containing protein n=1 Tax=Solanum pinnatisectum TaxID=50273 RepID=A0AAV9KX18_9SOLN|nr:hypothetical protein R3W88_016323 [Solanum pinnatisectum]